VPASVSKTDAWTVDYWVESSDQPPAVVSVDQKAVSWVVAMAGPKDVDSDESWVDH
jgi:hypothetical protein